MKWDDVPRPSIPIAFEVDPYLLWSIGPGLSDYMLPQVINQKFPILFRLNAVDTAIPESRPDRSAQRQAAFNNLKEATFADRRPIDKDDPYRTVFLDRAALSELATISADLNAEDKVSRISFGPPLNAESVAPDGSKPKRRTIRSRPVSQETVVIGIIDDGLPFGHERFRTADGKTRVEAVWIQDGDYDGGRSGFPYGREISRNTINTALAGATIAGSVDEDAFYHKLNLTDYSKVRRRPICARATHGAHVMDIACGFDPEDAPDWRIICVQLPVATTRDTSGGTLTPFAIDAVKYIRERADEIAGAGNSVPVVINFSYGLAAGPHDGTHDLEKAIDKLLRKHNSDPTKKPMRVVLPSGNSRQNRGHATHTFAPPAANPGEEFSVTWQILPDDLTPSFVEIWLPPSTDTGSRVALQITTPDGLKSSALEERSANCLELLDGKDIVGRVCYHFAETTSQRGMFFIALQPTARVEGQDTLVPTGPIAPSGAWTITLINRHLSGETVDAWIQRDDTPFGYPPRGRQSYFEHPLYLRYDYDRDGRAIDVDVPNCPVKRDGTMNAIATGKRTVVIGGLQFREATPAIYSAGGLLPAPAGEPGGIRTGPEAMTVSEDSGVHRGILGAGTRSGSVVALGGTSVAAPRITRWIAETFSQPFTGPDAGDRESVWLLGQAQDALLPGDTPSVERGGGGRIIFPPLRSRGFDG